MLTDLKRIEAARLAVKSAADFRDVSLTPQNDALNWARLWFAWLVAHPSARFTTTVTITDQHGHTTSATIPHGGSMATQMTMDDTVTLAAAPQDDHGDPTSDVLQFTADDNGAVLSLAVDGNTATGTPVGEGTVNITVTDPAAPNLQPDVITVEVGAGPTASIQVNATVNTGANTAPPPAGP